MRVDHLTTEDVLKRICIITNRQHEVWKDGCRGWAPEEVAELLIRARLDRQVSLSHTLRMWVLPGDEQDAEGRLILAWANLGALVEGSLKLFLTVWFKGYERSSFEHRREDGTLLFRRRDGTLADPEILMIEGLKAFFQKVIWAEHEMRWRDWVTMVQQRRNAVHAFADRDLGTHAEFLEAVRNYLLLLDRLDGTLPYPDERPAICWNDPEPDPWDAEPA